MRLHGITKLILFATALRFVANCVRLSSDYAYLNGSGGHPHQTASIFEILGWRFQEFALILLYVGTAVFIETLARLHDHLRRERISALGSVAGVKGHV